MVDPVLERSGAMSTISLETAVGVSGRFEFSFSGNGRYGTCLRADDDDPVLESWTFSADEARSRMIPGVVVDGETYALPLDDGRIIVLRTDKSCPSQTHALALFQPRGDDFCWEWLGTISSLFGAYLLPSPSFSHLGFLVALDCGHSTIWRLSTSPPRIEMVAQVPGFLEGGVWLDGDADVLAVNQTCGRYPPNGIAVDLAHGSWKRIWSRSVTSSDRILFGSAQSKVIIFVTTVSGEERLGWALLDDWTVHFPALLHRPGYERRAVALDDRGERLLLHEVVEATSRLLIYTPADDSLISIAGAPGAISSPACWTGNFIRCRFSAPAQPPTLVTMRLEP
jgi:hypothetical protein